MKLNPGKISTLVLWLCMFITVALFSAFYSGLFNHPDVRYTWETSALLYWLYILLVLTVIITGILSLFRFFRRWKEEPRTAWKSFIPFFALFVLFGTTFYLGDGTSLAISGYEGNENTYNWLKITDMWLFSIYILLGVTFVSVFAGILWSYFKKTK